MAAWGRAWATCCRRTGAAAAGSAAAAACRGFIQHAPGRVVMASEPVSELELPEEEVELGTKNWYR
jgi:hypothetical protein